ncbi:ATP-dependent DNA helicase II subunit 1 OS=Aspergillus oryzae (strain ATCC 42149 / RIB 40) GN=ku70 PE=3 SV=1 [Rhizoctonia solani AG-1 IB]|uniref:ATP-dependent DNA helicase II subunit 1 n=1 Tax=Thanatephorus cucumeris (strain AG1-IB / isolate 7/3/14) TaxID=1108050 RepID=A0A0B7FD04_THACB|nr:ATP-dependent DNA helicase II subunit 1 OS=Aspergillus oryzae (strain ATCC 42149 / RIB 40) GN=ku70 PE=3 SV=1 [Rhizoctonia solani AG-1 IB]
MPPFDNDWIVQDEDDEVELDEQGYSSQRAAILFCIDITPEILEPRTSPSGDKGPCALELIFQAAADLQKRKIVHGPGDAVGIMLFNTSETKGDIVKPNMYLYQHVSQVNAPDIQSLLQLLNEAEDNPEYFSALFSPSDKQVSMHNLFLTCSHVLRDGVPKATSKRIFFFTDKDDPELGDKTKMQAAQKAVEDLYNAGIEIQPFFMAQPGQPFEVHKFYSRVLARPGDELGDDVTINVHETFDKLLTDMRLHEATTRTLFNIPMQLGDGLVIGVKAYGLVTEQRKGTYKYFANMGKSMEEVFPKTVYFDEEQEQEVSKESIVFGYQFGTGQPESTEQETMDRDAPIIKDKVFYTPEEMKVFRTFNINPSIKILGFKDIKTLPFDANVKRSIFIHPNEAAFTGSIRTFKALLDSMLNKKKYALTRCLFRRNSAMIFCAMLPQEEVRDDDEHQIEPGGFHLIPLPYADDIRQPTVERSAHCSPQLRKAAVDIIQRMVYSAGYNPDDIPNPGLVLHYGFLQAEAFGEEYAPEEDFNDKSAPRFNVIQRRAGEHIETWHQALDHDPEAAEMAVEPKAGSKRKAGAVDELVVRAHYDDDILNKLTVEQLKTYLKAHSQPYSGRKNDLIERVQDWCATHPM